MSVLFSWPTVTVGMGFLPLRDGRRLRGEAPAHVICGWYLPQRRALAGAWPWW